MRHNISYKKEDLGVRFYRTCGYIILGCAVFSFLLLFIVRMMPQDYERYDVSSFFNIWFLLSVFLFALGFMIVVLCKRSKTFQRWAENDVLKSAEYELNKEIQKEKKATYSFVKSRMYGRIKKERTALFLLFLFSYVGKARLLYAISFHDFRKHGKRTYPYAFFSI